MHKVNIASLSAIALLTIVILTPGPIHAQTDSCETTYANTIPNIPKACAGKAASKLALKNPRCSPVTCPMDYKEEYNGCLRDEYSKATNLKVNCQKSQLHAPAESKEVGTEQPPPVRFAPHGKTPTLQKPAWGCAVEGYGSPGRTINHSSGNDSKQEALQHAMNTCHTYRSACKLIGCDQKVHDLKEAERKWPVGTHAPGPPPACHEVEKRCFSFAPHSDCVDIVCD